MSLPLPISSRSRPSLLRSRSSTPGPPLAMARAAKASCKPWDAVKWPASVPNSTRERISSWGSCGVEVSANLGRRQAAGQRRLGGEAVGRVFRHQIDPGLLEGAGGKADGAAADDEILAQKIERSPDDVEPAGDRRRAARPRHHDLAPPFAVEPMAAHESLARHVHLHIQRDGQRRLPAAWPAPRQRERRRVRAGSRLSISTTSRLAMLGGSWSGIRKSLRRRVRRP